MKDKLAAWGADPDQCEKILKLLVDEKFVDEKRYSTSFVKQKFMFNKWGRKKISLALYQKHIPPEVISTALDSIPPEEYKSELKALLIRKKETIKAKNQYDLMAKLQKYALGKGFESDVIHSVINDVVKKL